MSGDQLVYSPAGIKEQIQGILHDEIWFERMFDRQAMQPLRLTYDNLKEAPGETIASIASFLGVKAHTPEQRTTRASPVTHDDAAQWEARFLNEEADFLKQALSQRPQL
ncbi:Stf0 sulfotransferase family protein [Maricaulaceae bacterium EIL42A08]|nr:Stf0 sulfotransferase family protein [Maricaulaceae bacterium EIL42A08]